MSSTLNDAVSDREAARRKGKQHFDICTSFVLFSALDDLMQTVNLYKSRSFDEELEYVKLKLGGKT